MKVLEMCRDMFDKTPRGNSVKEFFRLQRELENAEIEEGEDNTDRGFFVLCCNYLGGRGYNEFLDYSLLAIKFNQIYNDTSLYCSGYGSRMREAISNLLHDDRHDMYQNIPYELDDYVKGFKKPEDVAKFWASVVDAMIDCINVAGTEDVSVNFTIRED